jgi:hypothetical protein
LLIGDPCRCLVGSLGDDRTGSTPSLRIAFSD